jgi:hypothetical protein
MRLLRSSLPALFGTAVIGCSGGDIIGPPPPPPTPNYIRLQSDPGDWVGAGRNYDYSLANTVITLNATLTHLSFNLRGDQWWYGEFQLPNTTSRLQPGTYANAQRYPFNDPAHPGIDWTGEGRGCNTQAGSFTIDSVTYAADVLNQVDLTFEQHCEGATPALHGAIHWRSDDTTRPPGPVTPIPSGLWSPAPGSTPASGTYVYLNSDPGDYIGAGQVLTYTSSITVSVSGGLLSIGVAGDWGGSFEVMNSINNLQVGYYGGLIRYPFNNPTKGGLSWSGQGRGCNTLTGWFALDHVTYTNNVLTSFDLRFEQHCEGGTAALHGAIHWDKP